MAEKKRVNASKNVPQRKAPRLGQNFLRDQSAIVRIVDALGDVSRNVVLEIGPGRGAITDRLAERAQRLIAVELDRMLAAELRFRYLRFENVEIVEGDLLKMDIATVVRTVPGPLRDLRPQHGNKVRVVGNLPYYITSDILLKLFEAHQLFDCFVIMVQKEVAERLAAKPGTKDYGLLSATAQLYTRVEPLFTLPPGAFSPPPKVHSTVLRLDVAPRYEELKVEPKAFIEFLKQNFGQKRKTLVNNLKGKYPEAAVRAALKSAGVRPDARAEALSLEQSAAVWKELQRL